MMTKRILVVLPHPDDEAFGLSGTLAKYISEGSHVTYACLTLGEMGRNMGVPPFASRITLPAIRKKELEASCQAIGLQDLRLLGFHDKTIEFEDQDKLDETIHALIDELEPTLVFTFYPGYGVHPDHDATGAAVTRTIGRMPLERRPVVLAMAFAKNTVDDLGMPDVRIPIIPYLQQKMATIAAHKSQFQLEQMLGGVKLDDKQIEERFGTERFYTYKYE